MIEQYSQSKFFFSHNISNKFLCAILNRYLCTTLDWLLRLSCVLSSVCLAWFAFGVFFVSTMNRYSCTTLDWLLRLSSVCFWRVPAFMFVGVGLLLA